MFNKERFVKEDDLFKLLTERDNITKNKVENNYRYFCNVKNILDEEIQNLKKQIENLRKEISEYKNEDFYCRTAKSKYMYLVKSVEQDITYSFETEETAINFFKNEIWQKKPFKANGMMWDAIYEAIRNGNIELAEDEIDDE